MRNPEAVKRENLPDTGYTHICPGCVRRSGSGKLGVRTLKLELCQECSLKRQRLPVKSLKHLSLGVVGR